MKIIGQFATILALGSMMFAGSAVAQSSTSTTSGAGPGVHDPNHPRVNQVNRREQRQQNRIANGMKNGSVTPKEAAKLEKGETRIENREKRMMAKDNGHLTKKDQAKLNRQENKESKKIYRAKHN
jgi:hypothetical protein